MQNYLHTVDEIGIDEAGRGCWWGPVYAGAVIWNQDIDMEEIPDFKLLTDSKKLSEKKRELLFPLIKQHCKYGIGSASSQEIDQLGIAPANKLAMNRAIEQLEKKFKVKRKELLIDGIGFKVENFNKNGKIKKLKVENVVKGDGKYLSIAGASVLAKVSRDHYCLEEAKKEEYKKYQLEKHKGYGTKLHREMLDEHGNSDQHRFSFKPCSQL